MRLEIVLKPKDKITEGLRQFVEGELSLLHIPRDADSENIDVRVTVNTKGNRRKVTLNVNYNSGLKSGSAYRVEENGDIYEVFATMVKKLSRNVKKSYKISNSRKMSRKEVAEEFVAHEVIEDLSVKYKTVESEPMTIDDAIDSMENLGFGFFLFLNVEDGFAPSVVYRREHDGYGCIRIK